jgi:hypothetical protein
LVICKGYLQRYEGEKERTGFSLSRVPAGSPPPFNAVKGGVYPGGFFRCFPHIALVAGVAVGVVFFQKLFVGRLALIGRSAEGNAQFRKIPA